MNPRTYLKSRFARALAGHAVRVAAPDHAEWIKAMMREQEHLPPDASALSWALGCVSVSYRGRFRALTRFPTLLRSVPLLMIFLLCLSPACWNFIYIGLNMRMSETVIFGSATLIGPIGLAAALWTLSSRAHRPGTLLMGILWTLTAWALSMVRLPAQYPLLTHAAPGTGIFTIILNFVLLPAVAMALLQGLNARRRRLAE